MQRRIMNLKSVFKSWMLTFLPNATGHVKYKLTKAESADTFIAV